MKKRDENENKSVNALLRKSAGDIANLTDDELAELQRLCTKRLIKHISEACTVHHPGVNPLVACLREEAYRRRISQAKAAEILGISYGHYNKIITGKISAGTALAKRMNKEFGIDGNFILENL